MSKKFKRISKSGFRQSHTPQAFWCYIPVTPSTRLHLRMPLPQWHWFKEQKNEEKFFERLSNSGFRHSHMSKALWCYIPVTPSTRLHLRMPLPHRHWFKEQMKESKNFKRMSSSWFRHSHMPKALWCYIPVTPSIRLYLRLPLPHRHWFMEQKNESKNFKRRLNLR